MAQWKRNNGKYSNSDDYYLGKILVASAFFDGTRPKGSELCYKTALCLPGLKIASQNLKTLEEAKLWVERAVNNWLKAAGLDQSQLKQGA